MQGSRLKDLARRICGARSVLLTTHFGPDGDGVGSTIALGDALEAHGIAVTRLLPEPLPRRYQFLDPRGTITHPAAAKAELGDARWDLGLILDTHQWEMLGDAAEWLRTRTTETVCLDHHPQEAGTRTDIYGDCDAASTGELVYRLLHQNLGWAITAPVAEALYIAISFDTNSFKHIRSNPASLAIAADLVTRGVDTNRVYRHLFGSNSPAKARLLGWVLSSAQFACEGRLAWVCIPHRLVGELGLERDEMRDSITHILEINGVEVAATLKEMEPGKVQISLRSKGTFPINGVAAALGGGGHPMAAGCDLAGTCEEAWGRLGPLLVRLVEAVPESRC
jgi:bifunctional oligoribonuclease and PAP phosphatase NrnA